MNLNPEFSSGTAIAMSLLAAFMWGTWFISLKYLQEYPIDGFYVTLFTTSLIFVWSIGLLLDGSSLISNIREVFILDPSRIYVSFVCGMLYVIGMRISLYVYKVIGLSLSQPIQSSINILAGTFVSGLVGGVPQDLPLIRIVIACIFLISAVLVSVLAGILRTRAQKKNILKSNLFFHQKDLWRALFLMTISAMFIPAYTMGLSYGLRSITQSGGLFVLPYMVLLCSGAFLGCMLTSGSLLTLRKQWKIVLNAPFTTHKFGIFSGIFHYGGNIIHAFATAHLSAVVSWPLGVTSGLWTQLWGLKYGEFKGATKETYLALFLGIILYLIGAGVIALR